MLFNIGAGEMILIALVLLIAVGPEQLPGLVRRAGRTMGQLRSMSDGLRRDFMSSIDELEQAANPRRWTDAESEPPVSPLDSAKISVAPPFSSSKDLEEIRNRDKANAGEAGQSAFDSERAEGGATDGGGTGGGGTEGSGTEGGDTDSRPSESADQQSSDATPGPDWISTDSSYDALVEDSVAETPLIDDDSEEAAS